MSIRLESLQGATIIRLWYSQREDWESIRSWEKEQPYLIDESVGEGKTMFFIDAKKVFHCLRVPQEEI